MIKASDFDRTGAFALSYDFQGQPDRPVTLNCYRATGYAPGKEVVLVQHGMMRNGDDYRDFWIEAAERYDLLIVAPSFPDAHYPEAPSYNDGMVCGADGAVTPGESWIYHVPARLVAQLTEVGVMAEGRARIYGHSAGGQFLHRMVSLVGYGPFRSVIAANAGWYSLPDLDAPFPAGLGGLGLGDGDLRRLLESDLWILGGEKDCESNADNLPSNPEALAQGPGRLQRAKNYMAQGRAAAARLGCDFNWRFTEVPGVAHDGCAMGKAAAGLWFEGALPGAEALGVGTGTVNA
ncbi:hypothetical protein I5535_08255 [Rhodobacteraceae bacterium F11138]|nr:hypothetical protein [Rhodobacteraceae bacterium F11138]